LDWVKPESVTLDFSGRRWGYGLEQATYEQITWAWWCWCCLYWPEIIIFICLKALHQTTQGSLGHWKLPSQNVPGLFTKW